MFFSLAATTSYPIPKMCPTVRGMRFFFINRMACHNYFAQKTPFSLDTKQSNALTQITATAGILCQWVNGTHEFNGSSHCFAQICVPYYGKKRCAKRQYLLIPRPEWPPFPSFSFPMFVASLQESTFFNSSDFLLCVIFKPAAILRWRWWNV